MSKVPACSAVKFQVQSNKVMATKLRRLPIVCKLPEMKPRHKEKVTWP